MRLHGHYIHAAQDAVTVDVIEVEDEPLVLFLILREEGADKGHVAGEEHFLPWLLICHEKIEPFCDELVLVSKSLIQVLYHASLC